VGNVLDNYFNQSEVKQRAVNKQYKDAHDRVLRCSYEVFYKNVYGQELREWLENTLKYPCGEERNFAYVQGQQDMIRTLLGYAETVKNQNEGRK